VPTEFLNFGLDNTCRIWIEIQRELLRLKQTGGADFRLQLSTSLRPYGPEQIAANRQAAAQVGFKPSDEMAFYGVELALESFLQSAQANPSGRRLLQNVMEEPSWWSRVSHFGIESSVTTTPSEIKLLSGQGREFPNPVYRLPYQFQQNGQLGLRGELSVTAPRSALRMCAGILEATLISARDANARITLQVVATRVGRVHSAVLASP
jgi:hypothetical protein